MISDDLASLSGATWLVLIAAALLAAVLVYFIARAWTKRRIIDKIDFMSDALLSGDSTFRYSESVNTSLNRSLNRLRGVYEAEKNDIAEKERYFGIMLDHVQSGVIVMDGEKVEYSNAVARGLLGMADISGLRQIERVSPSLAEAFRSVGASEMRASFSSERGTVQFSLSSCLANLHSSEVKIVTFNDITREMEDNESESWTRLIRVLTHEIMNTVTPIASLSSALEQNLPDYSADDIRSALGTIASSSQGLISFVQSYRSLTHIAVPVRKAFYFRDIALEAIKIAGINWPSANVTYRELSDDIILYADQGQISQVVNNLVKNAVQAGARNVEIAAELDSRDRVVIDVSNDGEAISPASQEQLFVPFFTTKGSEGTGVGLSLSRQLVRLNGGTIKLSASDSRRTTFTLVF